MTPKQKAISYTASYVIGSMTIGGIVAIIDYTFGTLVATSVVGVSLLVYLSHMVYTMKLREYNYEEK